MVYMGSKQRISKYIVPIIQNEIEKNNIHYYLEPFCGSCAIIDKVHCDRKFAYDINKYLIYLFIHVKSGGELPKMITKEQYDVLRQAWYNGNPDNYPDWLIGAAMLLSSFNGRGFSGGYAKPGYEKLKNGKIRHRDYYTEAKNNLMSQIRNPLFQDIMFGISDYRNLSNLRDYVIYVDKPYEGKKQYEYSKGFDHEEFWNIMRKWSQHNVVLISELEAPNDFECIWSQEVSRSIKANDKSKATEKIFRYYN